ncbi:MAG: hypothetical protein J5767_04075 [Paludibacteraceae bacterium]|nr:hypothetical protein [Paludibacteraceae bacterium]
MIRSEERISNSQPAIGHLNIPDKKIPLAIIHHPAQGYDPSAWRKYLQENAPKAMEYLSNM